MQGASPLCSPNSCFPIPLPTSHPLLAAPSWQRPTRLSSASSHAQLCFTSFQTYRQSFVTPRSTAIEDTVETSTTESDFIEIGYITSTHGNQGEVSVISKTDFPELRFGEAGKRWLRQQYLGQEKIQEVELIEGRDHASKKRWILKFSGVDSMEQAKLLIGSTILVLDENRPELEEGEFYTPDLMGMRVILKETGVHVGTVVDIFSTGACDLLRVKLESCVYKSVGNGKPKTAETSLSDQFAWVPFHDSIVPDVDMDRREMHITPPTGLLELNLRTHEKSKKERRVLEWVEKKKFQRRLISAKKILCEMEQQHVFHGFRFGNKSQGKLLADQIVGANSTLLRLAMQNSKTPSKRWDGSELVSAVKNNLMRRKIKLSEECLTSCASKEKLGSNFKLRERGLHLTSEGKVGIVLILNENQRSCDPDFGESTENSPCSLLQILLNDDREFVKAEDRASVPLILVCPVHAIQEITELFSSNDYFAFNSEKVWFLEEERLPVVSCPPEEEENGHKILMKSPWEILQTPIGSGGVISVLSSQDILENLDEMGVEYIEVCNINQKYVGGNSLLLGLVNSSKADMGIQIFEELKDLEENIDVIFSINAMKKLVKCINKMQFSATLTTNTHVEKVEKAWVDVTPASPNSYEFSSSIYSSLNACSLDDVCVMQIGK